MYGGVSTGYIVFIIRVVVTGTKKIQSEYDASVAKSQIQDYLDNISSSIMSETENAFSRFVTDIDYSVSVQFDGMEMKS